jgi:hypothetical protein
MKFCGEDPASSQCDTEPSSTEQKDSFMNFWTAMNVVPDADLRSELVPGSNIGRDIHNLQSFFSWLSSVPGCYFHILSN